jgi:hypothetical protein
MLMNHEDFDRMVTKHVAANTLRNVQDKLDNLKKKVSSLLCGSCDAQFV